MGEAVAQMVQAASLRARYPPGSRAGTMFPSPPSTSTCQARSSAMRRGSAREAEDKDARTHSIRTTAREPESSPSSNSSEIITPMKQEPGPEARSQGPHFTRGLAVVPGTEMEVVMKVSPLIGIAIMGHDKDLASTIMAMTGVVITCDVRSTRVE